MEHTGSLHKDPRKTIRETVVQEPRAVAGFCAKICCQEFVVRTTICQRTHGTIKSAKSCQVCHKDTSKEPSSKKHNIRHKRADEKVTEVLPLSRTPRFWKRQWRTGKTNICIRTNSCPQLYSTRGAKPVPFVLVFALEPHRWQGRTLSGIRDERNSHCFTTDCIGFNWFRCAGQHFRLKVYFKKKKNKEIRLARLRASYRYSIRTSLWDQGLSWFVQIWGGKLHLLHSWRAHWEFPCRWLCHSVPSCMFCSSLNSFDNFYIDFLRSSGLS